MCDAWVSTSSLYTANDHDCQQMVGIATAGFNHFAALPPTRMVLVAGGATQCVSADCTSTSVETYDPAAGTWTTAASESFAGTPTMPNWTALALGSAAYGAGIPAAAIYSPSSGMWTPIAAPAFTGSAAQPVAWASTVVGEGSDLQGVIGKQSEKNGVGERERSSRRIPWPLTTLPTFGRSDASCIVRSNS
jgi:hypothetical protein